MVKTQRFTRRKNHANFFFCAHLWRQRGVFFPSVVILFCTYISFLQKTEVGHDDESSEASDWLTPLRHAEKRASDWLERPSWGGLALAAPLALRTDRGTSFHRGSHVDVRISVSRGRSRSAVRGLESSAAIFCRRHENGGAGGGG